MSLIETVIKKHRELNMYYYLELIATIEKMKYKDYIKELHEFRDYDINEKKCLCCEEKTNKITVINTEFFTLCDKCKAIKYNLLKILSKRLTSEIQTLINIRKNNPPTPIDFAHYGNDWN